MNAMKCLPFLLLAACNTIQFSINGAGVDLTNETNNSVNGGCTGTDLMKTEVSLADMVKPLEKDGQTYDPNDLCLDTDPEKLEIRFLFELLELDTSKKPGDKCVEAHPGPYGKYDVSGVVFTYDYVEEGVTKSATFTQTCTNGQIDFSQGPNIAPAINACLDEIEVAFKPNIIAAINRHPAVIHVRTTVKECDPEACFSLGFRLRVKVWKSTARLCG